MKALTFARQLRTAQTDAETLLWSRLRAHRLLGLKFRRQQPLGPYVVDFSCPEKKLIVELDGGQHQEQAVYDEERDAWLKAEGYAVLRYWNNELMSNLEGVLEDICRCAGVLEPPSPQPLSPQGRGANPPTNPCLAPLPLEGGGVGGEGGATP
ncbi:MAG: endonuclease domain-containing protein [Betaproteobacteria bacterium]|nr:endonuclease domain-containing protein [Betaproteobacteria bacterium]